MENPLVNFYLNLPEPNKSVFEALRSIILNSDKEITEHFKWGLPFFCFRKKNFCYIWKDKKTQKPYLAMYNGKQLNHPLLVSEGRKMIKLLPINPTEDLPIKTILIILDEAKKLKQ